VSDAVAEVLAYVVETRRTTLVFDHVMEQPRDRLVLRPAGFEN